ncbi:unnamed protein product [Euphydryas editha]|uniref:Chitin-binding type-2 domain-containing protein n=1 Tax=Euphydryas editha TaxID=104508 RepID=A0AAU9TWW5_EUPED|nr:unnamed protein product [Euphydryas editha]
MEGKLYIATFLVICLVWQAQAQTQGVNCAQTGAGRFPDPTDTTCKNYTLCVSLNNATNQYISYNYVCPTTSLFNPLTRLCTTNYVCNTTTTNPVPPTTTVCTVEGFTANPNSADCTSFIQCVLQNGVLTPFPQTCPQGTFYDPATTLCEGNYVCPVTCAAAGRFPDTSTTGCRNYFLCAAAANGTLTRYQYTCPGTSVFNPNTGICTTTYTCTS